MGIKYCCKKPVIGVYCSSIFLERKEENESRKVKFHRFGEKEL